jgi:subtilisin family serine protease
MDAASGARAAGAAAARSAHLEAVPDSVFVHLESGADPGPFRGLVRAFGGQVRHEYVLAPDRYNVRGLPPGAAVALSRQPGVRGVSPDYRLHASLTETVPLLGALYSDPQMWRTDGGLGIGVCVLDSGVNRFHVMFDDDENPQTPTGRIRAWKDFIFDEIVAYDNNGHGSHVAGIIFGRLGLTLDGKPFQGMAPKGGMYIGKVVNQAGAALVSDVAAGIEWCAGLVPDSPVPPAQIINLSLGGGLFTERCDTTDPTGLAPLINAVAEQGILVVAAGGTEGVFNAAPTPACASGAMAVGATYDAGMGGLDLGVCTDPVTTTDRLMCNSDRWDFLDVVAPGCFIHSASGFAPSMAIGMCGTSQATAHVSGLAALVMAANRTMPSDEVRARILSTARDLGRPGFDRAHGHGRVLAGAAVNGCVPWEETEISCGDGADDDCDGYVDCEDTDCCGQVPCADGDADGDGLAACDCDDASELVWSEPGAVEDLRLSIEAGSGAAVLAWSPPASTGGVSLRYDAIRSLEPRGFFSTATCIETDDAVDTTALDPDSPAAAGDVFYYLVRTENDCPGSRGGLGGDIDGVDRVARSCP